MSTVLQLQDIRKAWEARDPDLVRLIEALIEQPDSDPDKPVNKDAFTVDDYFREIQSKAFRKKPKEEQQHYRTEQMKALESTNADVPLPDRLRLHEIIMVLWEDGSLFARQCLLRIIARIPLVYGPWRALKKIFKEAEARNDTEIYGALAARFDMAYSRGYGTVSRLTLGYLLRRAWRYLRRLGTQLPVAYPDVVCDFLIRYTDSTYWQRTWIANHIFYHETKRYGRSGFQFHRLPKDILKDRAFAETWQRTPRPLFSLLERAQSEHVWKFATTALKTDFRATLREVEPEWVARLVHVQSEVVDEFVIWILDNVPKFEQASFRELGLHEAVLKLFDSPSFKARDYAASYARTHARDLPIAELIRLMNNDNPNVRKLAEDLLKSHDPRKDVGLDAWGQLLETAHGHKLAASVIRANFGEKELTKEWFKERILAKHRETTRFAQKLIPQIHSRESLGVTYFQELLEEYWKRRHVSTDYYYNSYYGQEIVDFLMKELRHFDVNALDVSFLQRALLNDATTHLIQAWVGEGRLKPKTLTVDFLKSLAYHPEFEQADWLKNWKAKYPWAESISHNEYLANIIFSWLRDVREFSTSDLGFDWLLQLVMRSEPSYHDFAMEVLSKAFVPADFAQEEESKTEAKGETEVDLNEESFLFTGKLSTMNRKEAEKKVKDANGTVFSAVSAKLHYLVIGDEGSPLYGQGKKGSKQTKAESLNAKGSNIRIISETAFLQMLTEGQKSHSEDQVIAGCQRLWDMAIAGGSEDAPLAKFARSYIRKHHPDLAQEKNDKPVDPGAEMPSEFFTWDRVRPLFDETRKPLRDLALDLARWEFARWSPPAKDLVRLTESDFTDVREFVANALLAEESPETQRYRIDPDSLSPTAVYSFCESPEEQTRSLGMTLIQRSERLQIPSELFRLTESPDRRVRAFVIRSLWSLYRHRGITSDWKPSLPPQPTTGKASEKETESEKERLGSGAPTKPSDPPADALTLEQFLRRILFEIPGGRSESSSANEGGIMQRVKPLSARKAKLHLIEMMRDLALEDQALAQGLVPLLTEFMNSRGKSEQEACLVALTRINHHE